MFRHLTRYRHNLARLEKGVIIQHNQLPLAIIGARHASGDSSLEVGDWPITKEERERAAKKYNLIPEDYEPYDYGDAFGDYPKLKAVGAFNRDRYDDFDDPFEHRFYGEPYHASADLYSWERIDPLEKEKGRAPHWKSFLIFIAVAGLVPSFDWFLRYFNLNFNHPWKQRRYHPVDQKYYDFPHSSSTDSHH